MPIPGGVTLVDGGLGTPGAATQVKMATLGDAIFGAVDDLGSLVYLNDITGWGGATSSTGTVEQRSSDHGGWLSPAYRPPRVIGLSLTVVGSSYRVTEQSVEAISAAVPLDVLDTLTVYSTDGSALEAYVRQGGDVLSTQKGATASMSIALVAPDPRRYGTGFAQFSTGLPSVSGGLSLPFTLPHALGAVMTAGFISVPANPGNMSSPPTFTVAGPCPPFAITHRLSNRTIRSNEAVPAGRTLTIDVANRRALLDGTASRVITGSWFEIEPNVVNDIAFTASAFEPDALLTMTYKDAWR